MERDGSSVQDRVSLRGMKSDTTKAQRLLAGEQREVSCRRHLEGSFIHTSETQAMVLFLSVLWVVGQVSRFSSTVVVWKG